MLLPAAALALLLAPPAVTRSETPQGPVYTLHDGPCRIALETFTSDLNRHVLRYRSACPLPFAELAPRLALLFRHVLDHDPEPARFTSLFWGRLHPDAATDATLARRLALAAHASPAWNNSTGRPRSGHANPFVRDLANKALIYRELHDAFLAQNYEIRLSSVEKVLVLPARQLKFLQLHNPARLPFDAMVWFSLHPATAAPNIRR
jgi:hypothetical protein